MEEEPNNKVFFCNVCEPDSVGCHVPSLFIQAFPVNLFRTHSGKIHRPTHKPNRHAKVRIRQTPKCQGSGITQRTRKFEN